MSGSNGLLAIPHGVTWSGLCCRRLRARSASVASARRACVAGRVCAACARPPARHFCIILSCYNGVPWSVSRCVSRSVPLSVSLPARKVPRAGHFRVPLSVSLPVPLAVPLVVSRSGCCRRVGRAVGCCRRWAAVGSAAAGGRAGTRKRASAAGRRRRAVGRFGGSRTGGGRAGWRWLLVGRLAVCARARLAGRGRGRASSRAVLGLAAGAGLLAVGGLAPAGFISRSWVFWGRGPAPRNRQPAPPRPQALRACPPGRPSTAPSVQPGRARPKARQAAMRPACRIVLNFVKSRKVSFFFYICRV